MTIRSTALQRMLLVETAASKWWDGLSNAERQTYVRAHPRSRYALMGGGTARRDRVVPGGEEHRLDQRIGAALPRVADVLANDPAHAQFLHALHETMHSREGAVEAHPHHARKIERTLRGAADEIPGSGEPMKPHAEHGDAARTLLESAQSHLRHAGRARAGERVQHVKSALDMLRMSNHLQRGNVTSAHAHAMTLPLLEREMVPAEALRHMRRHAGGKKARVPMASVPRVVREHYRNADANGRDAARMNADISRRHRPA